MPDTLLWSVEGCQPMMFDLEMYKNLKPHNPIVYLSLGRKIESKRKITEDVWESIHTSCDNDNMSIIVR